MGCDSRDLLIYIARNGFKELKSSTLVISRELKVSQQTISRKLRELESGGYIKRRSSPEGIVVGLEPKGLWALKKHYNELQKIFKPTKQFFIGSVRKGIGEGKHYVSLPQYQKRFKELLGFKAFNGTLNLSTDPNEVKLLMNTTEPVVIEGFETKSRTFGSLKCYNILLQGVDAAIVVPERTRHAEEIIEVISEVYLRDRLNLKDGDKVKVNLK